MPSFPELPSQDVVEQLIDELKQIDLLTAEIDCIKTKLSGLFKGYGILSPILSPGQTLYRAVRWKDKPRKIQQLTYPPADKVKTFQRANRPHQPMFYASSSRSASIYELRPQVGDFLAISKWRAKEKIIVNNVGYVPRVFKDLGAARTIPNWGPRHIDNPSATNLLIGEYFATEFSKDIALGNEHFYKMSVAIAEKHYVGGLVDDPSGISNTITRKFGGLIYPTIASRANADNVALWPKVVDESLRLISVEWVKIKAECDNRTFEVTNLDFGNTFDSRGGIEWKGRTYQWTVLPGQRVKVSVEDGRFIVKDETGEIVDES